MSAWSETTIQDVNLEALAQVIHERGRPVHLNQLARAAVRARLQAEAGERLYAPGAQYTLGETIRFSDQSATVKAVKAGGNPKQGPFKILTLALPDGTERYMAAEVPGAPAEDRQPVTDEQVGRIIEQHGLAIRMAVQEALGADDRFVWFQDAQGDHWCLAEMLPEVRDEELAQVWPLLQGRLRDGVLDPCPTEAMVKAIWGQENDGSEAYLLKAFALNAALWQCQDVRRLGDGWVLEDEWRQLQERPALVGPRQPNVVTLPEGVEPVEEDEEEPAEAEEEEPPAEAETIEEDLEAWRRNRLLNATITLKAQHYYGNWLPLTQAMRRVFPPRASGADTVTFYHRFGGEEESFQAWVDWDQGRILGSPQMYQAFHDHGIYPGAKLVISHRGSEQEYDIRTKPVQGEQNVLVRRVFLAKDGTLEYEEVKEPIRYEIAQDVFVADARWEDLDALFRQAEEAGAGIFQLMYEKCCEWWEENDRQPLYVTAEDLFQAIHFDDQGRLTSKATIAWELWRRLAFEPAGDGKYRFRPEKGDRVRSVRPGRLGPRPVVAPPGPKVRKDKSLQGIAGKTAVMLPPVQPAAKPAEERSAVELPPQPPTAVIAPAVKVPDIGIRHIVYPIPFNDAPLAHETREILWERVGPIQRGSELTLWAPETPERLDEYLMQCIADRDANRFVTPRPVVDFMVNLAQPKPGERVADICCGTGIFLVKALRFVKEVYGEDADLELYGADIYDKAVEATRLNLLANGARNSTVVQADSLREQGGIFAQKYDLILGNPPFGGGQVGAFLRRWTKLLKAGGRAVVNVSESVLANSSYSDQEVRRWLVDNFELEAIVQLPRPGNSSLYGTKSNVVFLLNSEAEASHEVVLVSIAFYEQMSFALEIAQRRD